MRRSGRRRGRVRPDRRREDRAGHRAVRAVGRAGHLVRLHAAVPGLPGADEPADAEETAAAPARTGRRGRSRRTSGPPAATRRRRGAHRRRPGGHGVGPGRRGDRALPAGGARSAGHARARRPGAAGAAAGTRPARRAPRRCTPNWPALDPEAAAAIHPRNLHRVLRALEVVTVGGYRAAGRAASDLWAPAYRHPTLVVGLTVDRAVLADRIERRARRMLAEGAVDEVRRHRAMRGAAHGPAADQMDGDGRGTSADHARHRLPGDLRRTRRGVRPAPRPRRRLGGGDPRATPDARSPGCAGSRTLLS